MQAFEPHYISEDEYWELEQNSPIKHEYFDGRIYAMAGASITHGIIVANILASLVIQLRGKPCRAAGSDLHVKIQATGLQTYPDVTVYCHGAQFEPRRPNLLLDARVIFEVLSPSTEDFDRGNKFDNYKFIESLSDYLLASQDKARIDHYHRLENGDWRLHTANNLDATIVLESIESVLLLSEVYDAVELATGPEALRDAPADEEVQQ